MRLPQDVMSVCLIRTVNNLPCKDCKYTDACKSITDRFKVERPCDLYTINNHINGGAKNGIKQD